MEEKENIPKTNRQAFKVLDNILSDEEKKEILCKTKAGFCADEHFGLGLWIRNNWIHSDEEGTSLFAYRSDHPCILDPDYQSDEFLEKYYDHLKRKEKSR